MLIIGLALVVILVLLRQRDVALRRSEVSSVLRLADEALAEHSANLKSAGAVFAAILAGAPEIFVIDEV